MHASIVSEPHVGRCGARPGDRSAESRAGGRAQQSICVSYRGLALIDASSVYDFEVDRGVDYSVMCVLLFSNVGCRDMIVMMSEVPNTSIDDSRTTRALVRAPPSVPALLAFLRQHSRDAQSQVCRAAWARTPARRWRTRQGRHADGQTPCVWPPCCGCAAYSTDYNAAPPAHLLTPGERRGALAEARRHLGLVSPS